MTLLRDPKNIYALEDGEVFISRAESPHIGKLGLFGDEWDNVGVLAEGGNIELTRTIDETTTTGFGYGIVSRAFKAGDMNQTFETLEDNATTRWIAFPDTVEKDGVIIKRHTNKVAQAFVATVQVGANGVVQIDVSRYKAFLRMENVGRGEEVAGKQVTVGYVPGPDKDVLETRYFNIEEDGTMVELDPKIFVDDAEIEGTVADGTARQVGGGKPVEIADAQAAAGAEGN